MRTHRRLTSLVAALASTVVAAQLLKAQEDAGSSADSAPGAAPLSRREAPSLESWIDETKTTQANFPRSIVFARAIGDKPGGELRFLPIDVEAFDKLSFIKIANGASADWDYKLNKAKFLTVMPLVAAISLTKVDAVVLAPEKGDWQFLRLVGGQRSVLFSARPPSSLSPEDIVTWLFNSLGWDGVVIDQRGDYLLVGSMTQTLSNSQIQALAVGSSAGKFVLQPEERKGAGLLSLSQASQGTGIFDIVFLGQGVNALPSGTKLIIEKKRKKKK